MFWIFGVYDSENKCSDPHWNVETAPFLTRQLGSEMVYWMLIYLRMSYFAQYLYLELVRAGIICISVFKAGKSQLKMRNFEEKSLLLSVVQVPQLGKQ